MNQLFLTTIFATILFFTILYSQRNTFEKEKLLSFVFWAYLSVVLIFISWKFVTMTIESNTFEKIFYMIETSKETALNSYTGDKLLFIEVLDFIFINILFGIYMYVTELILLIPSLLKIYNTFENKNLRRISSTAIIIFFVCANVPEGAKASYYSALAFLIPELLSSLFEGILSFLKKVKLLEKIKRLAFYIVNKINEWTIFLYIKFVYGKYIYIIIVLFILFLLFYILKNIPIYWIFNLFVVAFLLYLNNKLNKIEKNTNRVHRRIIKKPYRKVYLKKSIKLNKNKKQ